MMQSETITQPLYDTEQIGKDGSATFFQRPLDGRKGLSETNMVIRGHLPTEQFFFVAGLSIIVLPFGRAMTPEIADAMFAYYTSGVVQLLIGSKVYLYQAPLGVFCPRPMRELLELYAKKEWPRLPDGEQGDAAGTVAMPAFDLVNNKLMLQPFQNFSVRITDVVPDDRLTVMVQLAGQLQRPAR